MVASAVVGVLLEVFPEVLLEFVFVAELLEELLCLFATQMPPPAIITTTTNAITSFIPFPIKEVLITT